MTEMPPETVYKLLSPQLFQFIQTQSPFHINVTAAVDKNFEASEKFFNKFIYNSIFGCADFNSGNKFGL